jgi:integrase
VVALVAQIKAARKSISPGLARSNSTYPAIPARGDLNGASRELTTRDATDQIGATTAAGRSRLRRTPEAASRDQGAVRGVIAADCVVAASFVVRNAGVVHGRRRKSIRNLRWSDVELDAKTVRWRRDVDNGYEQKKPLHSEAVAALRRERRA